MTRSHQLLSIFCAALLFTHCAVPHSEQSAILCYRRRHQSHQVAGRSNHNVDSNATSYHLTSQGKENTGQIHSLNGLLRCGRQVSFPSATFARKTFRHDIYLESYVRDARRTTCSLYVLQSIAKIVLSKIYTNRRPFMKFTKIQNIKNNTFIGSPLYTHTKR